MHFKYKDRLEIMSKDDFIFAFMSKFDSTLDKINFPYITECSLHDIPFVVKENKSSFVIQTEYGKKRFTGTLAAAQWIYDTLLNPTEIEKLQKDFSHVFKNMEQERLMKAKLEEEFKAKVAKIEQSIKMLQQVACLLKAHVKEQFALPFPTPSYSKLNEINV